MERPIWFKAKRFGYGWYPVKWQGWLIILLYIISVVLSATQINEEKTLSIVAYLLQVLISTIFLITISFLAGERPKWRWGSKKIN